MADLLSLNEQKIKEKLAQKIADYWNGRTIEATGANGVQWSSWKSSETNWRYRAPGTWDRVSQVIGVIHATASGDTVSFNITYQFVTELLN